MSTDMAIYLEILSPEGEWVCVNPTYPTKIGNVRLAPSLGISFPRNSTFFKALSSNGEFSTYEGVHQGIPEDCSEEVRDELHDNCIGGIYHMYLRGFQSSERYFDYLSNVLAEFCDMYDTYGEALDEHNFVKGGFALLSFLICSHLDSAGFLYWAEGNLERVRIVYGFY